jgi:hypothetical protein
MQASENEFRVNGSWTRDENVPLKRRGKTVGTVRVRYGIFDQNFKSLGTLGAAILMEATFQQSDGVRASIIDFESP